MDDDEEWMDWTDELWEIRRRGAGGNQMGPGLLCESSRCPQILQATEMPPAAKHQSAEEDESISSALSHVHS